MENNDHDRIKLTSAEMGKLWVTYIREFFVQILYKILSSTY